MEINADTAARSLLVSRKSTTPLAAWILKQNDAFVISLYFCKATGVPTAPFDVIAMPDDYTRIALAARPLENLTEDALLFSATEWELVGSGVTLHYEANLNLNTEALLAKFPDTDHTTRSIEALLDIELRSEDATKRESVVSLQRVLIHRDIYRGDEGVPVDGDPAYPLPEDVMLKAPADGGYRVAGDGTFQIWNPTQGAYQTIGLIGAPGAETLIIAAV